MVTGNVFQILIDLKKEVIGNSISTTKKAIIERDKLNNLRLKRASV